ncbi:MAG: DsbA family protein [Bdellovibrionales bacterium]|nr:DsbA family protein [Bdellovibrionales bacterium]
MNKKLTIASIFILFAITTHGYLTSHYYPLKFGMVSGKSVCNFSDTMDCDVAAASAYSDALGVPLSVFGLVYHLIMLVLIAVAWSGLSEDREKTLRYVFYLSALSVFTSIIMAIISATQLSAWCPFCILAYVWSLIIAGVLYTTAKPPFSNLSSDITSLFTESKGILIALLLIPGGSWLTHKSIQQRFGSDQFEKVVRSSISDWVTAKQYEFNIEPALSTGSGEQKFELVEFADFRCGHCGQAAPSLQAFKKAHPEITFKFYNFPLDGECNDAIGRKGDGISCRLAKSVTCASQSNSDAGWKLHDHIFANQRDFQQMRSTSEVDAKLQTLFAEFGLNTEEVTGCMDSDEALEAVRAQAKMGDDAKIKGTPTIFVNGRRLPRAQLLPVLNEAFKRATK